jgi:two-component system, OmpR family, KDP operon response regulator KdpE
MAIRILVVDDEPAILATMAPLLRSQGYDVVTALSGRAAIEAAERDHPDLVVLDLGLPDIEGVEVCRTIRLDQAVPIIVLSARGAERNKVAALDAGADDYVTKPFGTEELLARIRAALRRTEQSAAPVSPTIVKGDLAIDRDRRRVVRGGVEIRLTPKEFELLVFLAQQSGRVVTHRSILKAIWGPHSVDQPEHLRVLVGALRKKIEPDPSRPQYILTEPWVGYRFNDAS